MWWKRWFRCSNYKVQNCIIMTSTIKVNTIKKSSGSSITIGESGDTISLASGASQSGFGRSGTVDWQTTIKTSGFTASDGEGYFLNTTSGGFTVNLPAGSAGSIVAFKDYAQTWDTGNVTITPNGSDKIAGTASSSILSTESQSVTLIFTDSTRGWIDIHDSTSNVQGATFLSASGGNAVVTCGNFKTHIFTGPGTFTVCSIGNPSGSDSVDYLVVAGGGSGGSSAPAGSGSGTGGGGAGGFRLANHYGLPGPTTSPLANPSSLPVSVQGYPITVGGGASAASSGNNAGNNGNPSVFSTITSTAGGGGAASPPSPNAAKTGGSGGGGGYAVPGAAGNTPPVSPPQGNAGGNPSSTGPQFAASGGGGAGAAGSANPANNVGGAGGVGSYIADSFIGPTAPSYGSPGPVGSTRFFAGGGGGGGGIDCGPPGTGGAGGSGGGGAGGNSGSGAPGSHGAAGTANTGGGGGGSAGTPSPANGGGSGIVMIRYRFQ